MKPLAEWAKERNWKGTGSKRPEQDITEAERSTITLDEWQKEAPDEGRRWKETGSERPEQDDTETERSTGAFSEMHTRSADTRLEVCACSDWIEIKYERQTISVEYNAEHTSAETADELRSMADVLLSCAAELERWDDK